MLINSATFQTVLNVHNVYEKEKIHDNNGMTNFLNSGFDANDI